MDTKVMKNLEHRCDKSVENLKFHNNNFPTKLLKSESNIRLV